MGANVTQTIFLLDKQEMTKSRYQIIRNGAVNSANKWFSFLPRAALTFDVFSFLASFTTIINVAPVYKSTNRTRTRSCRKGKFRGNNLNEIAELFCYLNTTQTNVEINVL